MSINTTPALENGGYGEGGQTGCTERSEAPSAEISIHIDQGAIHIDGYPHGDLSEGNVFLFTYDSRELFLGVRSTDGSREFEGGFYFDPDTAEEVADLLYEFAKKTRDEDCVEATYP